MRKMGADSFATLVKLATRLNLERQTHPKSLKRMSLPEIIFLQIVIGGAEVGMGESAPHDRSHR